MGAIALQTHSVLRFSNNSCFANHSKLGKHTFSLTDVTLGVRENRLRLAVSCVGSDGDRRSRPSRRSSKSDGGDDDDGGEKAGVDKKPNPASQEEIIAIFRRIQSSISKEDSVVGYDVIGPNVSDKKSPVSSILKVLHESGTKQGKAKNDEGNKRLTGKRVVPKKEQRIEDYPLPPPPPTGSKLTRPPSKFVRRSPIPSPPTPRRVMPAGAEPSQLPKVETMKLVELKEIAKSRGLKGYSKLKKSELISLLRS